MHIKDRLENRLGVMTSCTDCGVGLAGSGKIAIVARIVVVLYAIPLPSAVGGGFVESSVNDMDR